MVDILRKPDDIHIECEEQNLDAVVDIEIADRKLNVYITAEKSRPRYIMLRWNYKAHEPVRVMGDKWERAYADMEWHSLNGEIFMPWYFMASNGKETVGCGVMTQPNSFVSFEYDASGVSAWFDVRSGGAGVQLNGRKLLAGVVVCEHYENMSEFQAAKLFCKVMSPNPVLPKAPVYGSNNWYYAYGNSSKAEILEDAKLLSQLTENNSNKPFMVIDDGWAINACSGPWRANEKFGDMKSIAEEFQKMGVKPGIWFRPFRDAEAYETHPEWRLGRTYGSELCNLDPSHPEVKEYLRNVIRTFKDWGFQLIKHDFSTFDMFGKYGFDLNGKLSPWDGWQFYDGTKTSAEIVLDFYRLIKEEAEDIVIIGCNAISHLCAGIFEINRIGDDTSGRNWSRTRALGVNTLAFRLCQNDSFYKADADCVGILGNHIDWKLNKQWLELLSKSGSPLFVSAEPSALTDEMKADLKEAFAINSVQENEAEPLDWLYNNEPQKWIIDGEMREFDFVMDDYPTLLTGKVQDF